MSVRKIVDEKERVLSFGKIDYWDKGRKINEVEITVKFKTFNDGSACFTITGAIWNSTKTDHLAGGQILDYKELADLEAKNELFREVKRLWKTYHLNNMHAGTPKQENALREAYDRGEIKSLAYETACEYLKSIGLYEDDGYRYGSSWLYRPIPNEDLAKINKLFCWGV